MTICLFLLMAGKASAQWSVIDPTNIAQSIIIPGNNIMPSDVIQHISALKAQGAKIIKGDNIKAK